jgi:hypothetical protein
MAITVRKYTFEGPFTSTNSLEDKSGIYTIHCCKNSKYFLIDGAESATLKTRMDNHDRVDCWKRNCNGQLTASALYAPNKQQEGRKEFEQEIRSLYNPAYVWRKIVTFQDAIVISKQDIETKPYLLSHLSREIESGLRDVLAVSSLGKIENCETCSRPINQTETHKESILNSLGIKQENELVKKWFSTAKNFHKYAHRHGVWKNPREKIAFGSYWNDFVDVLDYLVGSYYALADRVDSIIKKDPTQEIPVPSGLPT